MKEDWKGPTRDLEPIADVDRISVISASKRTLGLWWITLKALRNSSSMSSFGSLRIGSKLGSGVEGLESVG